MKTFSRKTIQLLKHYVYALVNPENEEIFYVGRGKNERGLQHLKLKTDENNSNKQTEIEAIRSKGLEPRLEILRYGLEKETAIKVGAAIIDWFPAGTTVSTRPFNSDGKNEWEFVGSYAKTSWSKYKNRILHEDSMPLKASQIGFRYIN